jgi:hypothetical protein
MRDQALRQTITKPHELWNEAFHHFCIILANVKHAVNMVWFMLLVLNNNSDKPSIKNFTLSMSLRELYFFDIEI